MVKNILTLLFLLVIILITSVVITKGVITYQIDKCVESGKSEMICNQEFNEAHNIKDSK